LCALGKHDRPAIQKGTNEGEEKVKKVKRRNQVTPLGGICKPRLVGALPTETRKQVLE